MLAGVVAAAPLLSRHFRRPSARPPELAAVARPRFRRRRLLGGGTRRWATSRSLAPCSLAPAAGVFGERDGDGEEGREEWRGRRRGERDVDVASGKHLLERLGR